MNKKTGKILINVGCGILIVFASAYGSQVLEDGLIKRGYALEGTILDNAIYCDINKVPTFAREYRVGHYRDMISGTEYCAEGESCVCNNIDAAVTDVVPAYTQFTAEQLNNGVTKEDVINAARHGR